jgi:hypothetical protein
MIYRKEMFYDKKDADRAATKLGILLAYTLLSLLILSIFDLTFIEALGALGIASVLYVVSRSKAGLETFYGFTILAFLVWIVTVLAGVPLGFLQACGIVVISSLIFMVLKKELPGLPEKDE